MNKKYFNSYSKFIYFNLITLILFITTGLVTEIFTILDVEATNVNSTENNTNLITETVSDLNTETTTSTNCDITKSEPESTTIESTTTTQKSNNSSYEEDSYGRYYWFKASCTAYCGCSKCCGKWSSGSESDAVGAKGTKLKAYQSIAVDPKVIPLGTILHDSTGKQYVAEDTGSAINGYRIDIFTGNHQEAKELGVKEIELYW